MASSSSSSRFIHASNSQSWNHDVFLSFRGEDTRKGFVDHLYTALVKQGIQTYKDDETLPRGATIGPTLFKAIQESRIAVIVFSENYADSSWCLDELTYIVECMENKGQIIMPVFYDVDPSDVRKQTGKYGEAFVKHERENKHKVESWRKALFKTGNLSGWVPKDFAKGHEAKCVADIVATISNKLTPLITNVNKDLIGIEARLIDLKSMLEIGSGGVRMIGIWGVGGGGKTTLASAAYLEISHQFEACCLLENIREESSKYGLKKLQENFLSLVLKTNVVIGSEIEGSNMIKRKFCHKSVLAVLDDVNDLKQLKALAGAHDWFGEGSRIIITTRDEHLLTRQADMIYEVRLLSNDEAIKLFNRHAYQKDKPVEDYDVLSQEVVSYAGGLPLALEVLGSFLYDKDKEEWKCALAKLKRIPEVQVMERLKLSYDGLEHDEKELFLDIACFLRRSLIDKAMTVLDACSFHPGIGVKVLLQKSLIKVSNGRFDMHDLIEEMAHYIVRAEHPNNLEKHSRIWESLYIEEFYEMAAAAPLMETEVLALRDQVLDEEEIEFSDSESSSDDHPCIPDVIVNMKKHFLDSGSSYDNHQCIHDVIANMKKLRWISLEGFPASSFPSNFQATNLGCLMLRNSNLKLLWKGYKHLPNLKILDLWYLRNLTRTPNFKGLPCLERLILLGCKNLKKIHPSIGYHEKLIFVKVRSCPKLKMFPPIIQMKKLETLDLRFCKLRKFPDIQRNMDSLVNLFIDWSGIEIIPPSVGQYCTNLVYFCATCCNNLKRIEGDFRLLKHLKELDLIRCRQLEKLAWDFFDEECCLEELSLSMAKSHDSTLFHDHVNCVASRSFHQGRLKSPKLPHFPRLLRKLNLSFCNLEDGDIPDDMSGLLNVQVLHLRENKFSRLSSSLSQIPCLKFLDLSYCGNLVELPDLPSSIEILIAEYCKSLESVGDLSNYKWLWKISLQRRHKLIGGERILHSMLQGGNTPVWILQECLLLLGSGTVGLLWVRPR